MNTFDLMLQYRLPISKELKVCILPIKDENYKEDFLLYSLPVDTDITAECGDVEMNLTFMKTEIDADGNQNQYVRKIDTFTIPVISIASWFSVPDSALDSIVQLYLANQQNIRALEDLVGLINDQKADNIKLDIENNTLYLTGNGEKIGSSISLEDLGNAISEATPEGLVKINI